MIISRRHKFAFVHIPKTGGTTITSLLLPYLGRGPKRGKGWQTYYHTFGMHGGIREFNGAKKYFKFAFVRNPWDWLVSLYKSGAIKKRAGYVKRPSWEKMISLLSKKHPQPQLSWLTINGKIAVDYIARLEDIDNEVDYIFKKLGLKYNKIPHRLKRGRPHYTEWYNDKSRKIVARVFRKDIKMFGYKYGTTI